jgi:DNA-binding transcriptional ArsR family regulator
LIQLITKIAPAQGGWVFDAAQDWLGEQLGISGQAMRAKLHRLDQAGLILYLHSGQREEGVRTGRPRMRLDLQPLVAALWESCAKLENSDLGVGEFSNFRNDPPTNVHALYSGTGQYADASMRTLYKFAVARMGYPTVLMRNLTPSALTVLDYLVRHGETTRAEMVGAVGMTPGAAAGGTRVLEQLGIVSVEWEGPGIPKLYILRPDWEKRILYIMPHMASFGAKLRLVIRNYDRWIAAIDRMLKTTYSPQRIVELKRHIKKLETARKSWCLRGRASGEYGRYVDEVPPW